MIYLINLREREREKKIKTDIERACVLILLKKVSLDLAAQFESAIFPMGLLSIINGSSLGDETKQSIFHHS